MDTRRHGCSVAVMKERSSGAHSKDLALSLSKHVPMFFFLFTSQKSICPAMLPKPPTHTKRPWWLQRTVLCGPAPKVNMGTHFS